MSNGKLWCWFQQEYIDGCDLKEVKSCTIYPCGPLEAFKKAAWNKNRPAYLQYLVEWLEESIDTSVVIEGFPRPVVKREFRWELTDAQGMLNSLKSLMEGAPSE